MQYLLQGLMVGLAYVAPIGTQNMFVINTALTQKRSRVFITALIVCFFDVSLSMACFFGVGAVMTNHPLLELIIIFVGALVVIWIGIGLVRAKGSLQETDTNIPVSKILVTACVVTWFNPQALIDGTMLLGASRAACPGDTGTWFIIGAALASVIWWFGMSAIVNLLRTKFTDKVLRIINIICGAFIIFYGCKLLYSGKDLLTAYIQSR